MKLAIAIFRYFPYGGLQRDMRFIAEEAIKRGHQVTIFCGDWQGDKISGADIRVINTFVWFNIAGVRRFVKAFEKQFNRNEFDLLLGFNKMPGLDVYYCGDSCFAKKAYEKRFFLYRFLPRSLLYLHYEAVVYRESSLTKVIDVSDQEREAIIKYYSTQKDRFFLMPPGIVKEYALASDRQISRKKIRDEFSIANDIKIILCVGSGFQTKGLDRSIKIMSELVKSNRSNYACLIAGSGDRTEYQELCNRLGVKNCIFVGGRNDMADIYAAGDLLLHPAYNELTGNVLVEAMVAGLPVVCTPVCGYANYIGQNQMGYVIENIDDYPFVAKKINQLLDVEPDFWIRKSEEVRNDRYFYSRNQKVVDCLDSIFTSQSFSRNAKYRYQQNNYEVESICCDALLTDINNISGEVVREMPGRRTLRFTYDEKCFYLKLHLGVGWREILKNLFQLRSPILGAVNEWRALRKLSQLGIPSLEAVAWGWAGANPATCKSFLITRELSDVIQLDHYLQANRISAKEKRYLIERIAVITREMHQAGINHRDLYLCHFMLKRSYNSESPELFVIDLHRAQMRKQVPFRWLVKDLAALYYSSQSFSFSKRDFLRFIKIYFRVSLRSSIKSNNFILEKVIFRAAQLQKKHGLYINQ